MCNIILKYDATLAFEKDIVFNLTISHSDFDNPLEAFNSSVNGGITSEITEFSQSNKREKLV